MNLGKIIEELRENAAELKDGIETINNRLDSIEKNMKVSRDSHNKMDKKLDSILLYLKSIEAAEEKKASSAHICERCIYREYTPQP